MRRCHGNIAKSSPAEDARRAIYCDGMLTASLVLFALMHGGADAMGPRRDGDLLAVAH